jgi:hypothetical protein
MYARLKCHILLKDLCFIDVVPRNSGNISMHFLNNLSQRVLGNGLKRLSFGKCVVHGSDTRQCGAFARILCSKFRSSHVRSVYRVLG